MDLGGRRKEQRRYRDACLLSRRKAYNHDHQSECTRILYPKIYPEESSAIGQIPVMQFAVAGRRIRSQYMSDSAVSKHPRKIRLGCFVRFNMQQETDKLLLIPNRLAIDADGVMLPGGRHPDAISKDQSPLESEGLRNLHQPAEPDGALVWFSSMSSRFSGIWWRITWVPVRAYETCIKASVRRAFMVHLTRNEAYFVKV
ncbi:MAG: hypothetical protein Q9188_005830 [Gyalolechia gomerana]